MDDIRIVTGDFRDTDLADGSVDLVISDPVYQNTNDYADIARLAARVLVPGGNCVLQCGHEHLPDVLQATGEHLDYVWLLVALQNHGNGRLWNKKIFASYKPWVWFTTKGDKRKGRWIRDSSKDTYDKKHHVWGDGTQFMTRTIEQLTEPGDLVLDPCLGSGPTAEACLQTGRRCIGYELDPATADVARMRLATAQLPLFIPAPLQQMALAVSDG